MKTKKSWEDWNDPAFRQWVAPYFIQKLGDIVHECANEKGFRSINRLQTIQKSGFQLPREMKDQVYASTFSFFNFFVIKGKLASLNPFIDNSDCVFKVETIEHLHPHYLAVLKLLPKEIFQPVIADYGRLGYHILSKAFYKDRRFNEFGQHALHQLSYAADIYLFHKPEDQDVKKLAKDIRAELYGSRSSSGSSELSAWQVIKFILIFTVVILRIATCSSSSSKRSTAYNDYGALTLSPVNVYVNKTDMIGEWEATLPVIGHPESVKRIIRFSDEYQGKSTWQLLDPKEKIICEKSHTFKWEITAYGTTRNDQPVYKNTHLLQFSYDVVKKPENTCQSSVQDSLLAPFYQGARSRWGPMGLEPFVFVAGQGSQKPTFTLSQVMYRKKE